MIVEGETCENQRARAWNHKNQLDNLPTFSLKLNYWLENIGSYPYHTEYADGENAPFTLGISPETDNDRRELHCAWMESHRTQYIEENEPVTKFGWIWSEADKQKIAFTIKSVEALKADLEVRLSNSLRKKDLLESDLRNVTIAIDAVGKTINNIPSPVADEINKLRYCLETNRPYDFAFTNELFPSQKAVQLAQVWDIVHFEAYLKDRLVSLQIGQSQTSLPILLPASKIEIRPFPELLIGDFSEINLIALLVHLKMRDENGQTIWPKSKKSGPYGVIDALKHKGYLVETTLKEYISSLSTYLGLSHSRAKDGYSKIQASVKIKALSFINHSVKIYK